ncbi:MAG: SCO family protein [Gammaproteobacteria bacterium]
MRKTIVGVAVIAAVLALAGCSGGQKWETTNITHVMPNLKFTLTRDNGKVVHADNFRGKVTMLYLGYTNCPDICPETLADIAHALHMLGPEARQVRVLFVSVDPHRDTLPVLKKYTAAFGPQFIGLTGTQNQLRALAARYREAYSYGPKYPKGNYVVNHGAGIYVFDKKGGARLLMTYHDKSSAIAHDLKQLLG